MMDTLDTLNETVEKRSIVAQKAAVEHDWLTAYGEYLHLKQITGNGDLLYDSSRREYYYLQYALLVMDEENTDDYRRDYTTSELAAMITQTYKEVLATEPADKVRKMLKTVYLDNLEEAAATVFEMLDDTGKTEHLRDSLREMREETQNND